MSKLITLLFITVIIKQLVWIAFIPLWHFPDEQAHFGQVTNSVEIEKRKPGPNLTKEIFLSEQILQTERDWAGNNRYTYHPEYNIPYSLSYYGFYENEIADFPLKERSVLVKEEATFYPPLYYIPAIFSYKLFYNNSLFTRVFIARIVNIVYTVALGLIAYKTFELVFNKQKIAFLGTVIVLFHPMLSFMQGGINSDNLFNLFFTSAILMSLIIMKKGPSIKNLILAILVFIFSIYTKPQAYLLLAIYFFPLIYLLFRKKSIKLMFVLLILFILGFVPLYGRWVKGGLVIPDIGFNLIGSANVNLPSFLKWSVVHTYREVLPWYWGVFRWLSLTLPRLVNKIINRVLVILVAGVILYALKTLRKRKFSFETVSLIFFLYISIVYFLIITFWNYLFASTHGFSFGIQGRYFFPVIGAHIGILLFGVIGFTGRARIQVILATLLAVGMIIFHEVALFQVLFSYFSRSSISTFFITASQYKPWFFKSPVLEYLMLIHLLTVGMIFYMIARVRVYYEKT